jgi:predicted ABC-type ATPase
MANRAEIYDNSDRRRSLIAQKFEGSPLSIVDPERWAKMVEIADEKHDLPGNV